MIAAAMTPLPDKPWDKLIKPGTRIYFGGGVSCPFHLVESLVSHAQEIGDLMLMHPFIVGQMPWQDSRYETAFRVNALGLDSRSPEPARHVEYTPCYQFEVPALFRDKILRPDLAIIMVSPPDPCGYCSLGPSNGSTLAACEEASVVIAVINPLLPAARGNCFIHEKRISYFLEHEQVLPLPPERMVTEAHRRVGQYVAQLVDDGATIQAGLGPVGDAVLDALSQHRYLGIHSQILTDAVVRLIQSGAVDNSRKSLNVGKTVASWAVGSELLYKFLDRNPHIEMQPVDYTGHPLTLSRQDRMVAINSALAVDLTGQVSVEPNLPERIGAADLDFIRGVTLSNRGDCIIAMPSTFGDGASRKSRVVLRLDPACGFGSTRADVHHVVTEFGIATLRGGSLRQRVMELIQVAHPDYREGLLAEAREHQLVPRHFVLPPALEPSTGAVMSRRVTLRDGKRYLLRPLNPSDDHRLQQFFYTHTEDTIHRRYGFMITRMSQQRAYELVSVDQNRDLALGIFEVQGPREEIHAVGRYYLDKKGKGAEMAFVVGESKRRAGMARTLLDEMISIALARGLKRLWAQVDRDNNPMLRLFQQYHADIKAGDESNIVRATIELEKLEVARQKPVQN